MQLVETSRMEKLLQFEANCDNAFQPLCMIKSNTRLDSRPLVQVQMCDSSITMLADSGAPINLIDECTYYKMLTKPVMQKSSKEWNGFGSTKALDIVGQFVTTIVLKELGTKSTQAQIDHSITRHADRVSRNESKCTFKCKKC